MSSPPRSTHIGFGRPMLTCLFIVGLYYLLPVEPGVAGASLVLRTVGTIVVGLLITWQIVRQISRQIIDPQRAPIARLLTALVGGVVFFALADYAVAVLGSEQFAGLRTKTDALYFALSTLTTVGYGDVHATGQVARAVVAVQLVFNVVVVATGATVLIRQLGARIRVRTSESP